MYSMFNHVIRVFIQYLEPCALKLEYVSPRGHSKICLSRQKWQFLFPQFIPFICDISIPYTFIKHLDKEFNYKLQKKPQCLLSGKNAVNKNPQSEEQKEKKNFIGVNSLQTGAIHPLWTLQV